MIYFSWVANFQPHFPPCLVSCRSVFSLFGLSLIFFVLFFIISLCHFIPPTNKKPPVTHQAAFITVSPERAGKVFTADIILISYMEIVNHNSPISARRIISPMSYSFSKLLTVASNAFNCLSSVSIRDKPQSPS